MLISWNVNSINIRLTHLIALIRYYQPTILLLQEIKCMQERFPEKQISKLGYYIAMVGQKSYHGVAIISKYQIKNPIYLLEGININDEARYIEATIIYREQHIKVISVYVPNGRDIFTNHFLYKQYFLNMLNTRLKKVMQETDKIIIGGDFNIALESIDTYCKNTTSTNICLHPKEQCLFRQLLVHALFDSFRIFHPCQQIFSWWDYRRYGWQKNNGLRLDYIFVSSTLVDLIIDANIIVEQRQYFKPSDHVPIYISWIL